MERVTGLIGRDQELQGLNTSIATEANILIIAPSGFGKATLLSYARELAIDYRYFHLNFLDTTFARALKEMVKEYHDKDGTNFFLSSEIIETELPRLTQNEFRRTGELDWTRLSRYFSRLALEQLIQALFYSLHWKQEYAIQAGKQARKPIIFVENLKRVTDGNVAAFKLLFQKCQIIAVLDKKYWHLEHLQILTQHFQSIIDLKPLSIDHCFQIAEKYIKYETLNFDSEKAHVLFLNHIARDCGGSPKAIQSLLKRAALQPKITKDKIRQLEWDGVQYFSMYPLFMVSLVILAAFRTLGRTIGDTTWVVIGAISGILLVIAFFLRPVLDKK
ncbi:MAG: hypothetical protein KAI83_20285 [Thiomargarita sp.]|nr:hypothetical protein [Thiomargarita sp.]